MELRHYAALRLVYLIRARSLNTQRSRHTATLLPDGTVLACGGVISGLTAGDTDATDTCEVYDPTSGGSWSATDPMEVDRYGHTATLLENGRVLVCGGFNDTHVATEKCELYDPTAASESHWSSTGDMNDARGGWEMSIFTATLLEDGRVLVTGGRAGSGQDPLSSSELYDPTTGMWSLTGAMLEGRYIHTATLLSNGKVLVAGGYTPTDQWQASCELYDPGTERWCSALPLAVGRGGHTATLLDDGRVLVAGGTDTSSSVTDSSELYVPGSDQCIPTLSEWGLVVMALLMVTGTTLVLMRRRRLAT